MTKRRDERRRREEVGARIRKLREERGLSQGDLGAQAGEGLSQTEVSKIENGHRWPSVPQLSAICTVLGIEPAAVTDPLQRAS